MVARTYGVKNAAGVSVTEEDVRGPITPGSFGSAGFTGVLEKGNPGEPIVMVGPKQMKRKVGGRIASSLVPDAIEDYWDSSEGSGLMVAVRVTDGTEQGGGATLMSRHTGAGFIAPNYDKSDAERMVEEVLRIDAKNGGRWSGRYRLFYNTEVNVIAGLAETTVDTGLTMLEDELVDGYVVLEGTHSTSGKQYDIIGNTTAGVISVRPGSTMLSDVNETVQVTIGVAAQLDPVNLGTNRRKGVAVKLKEGTFGAGLEFGLDVYVDGDRVYGWDSLSMDPDSPRYAPTVINNDEGNEEIEVTDLLQTGVLIDEYNRPGNVTRMVTDVTGTRIWLQPVLIESNDHADKTVIVSYDVQSAADDSPYGLLPGKMTFTWDTDHYEVEFASSEKDGILVVDDSGRLPNFTPIAAASYEQEYDPGIVNLPTITIDLVSTPTDDDQFVIHVLPIRPDMVTGDVFPDVDAQKFNGFVIRETTHDSVTVESGDPSLIGSAGTVGLVSSAAATMPGNTFAITSGTNDQMLISIDGRTEVTVTLTPAAPGAMTATEIETQVNAAFIAIFGAGVLGPASVLADPVGGDLVVLTSPGGFDDMGPASVVTLRDDNGGDLAYAALGITIAAGATANYRGTSGTRARVEYLQDLADGFDGGEPPLQKYMEVFAVADSPYNDLVEAGYGNLMLATPGLPYRISAGDVVTLYKQAFRYAESKPYAFFAETPIALSDEADVQTYWETTVGRSDMGVTYLPSFVNVIDPDAAMKLKVVSSLPMVIGQWAKTSVANDGYHMPAAGVDAKLTRVQSLPDGYDNLNEEFLTPGGYNVIKNRAGSFLVWGARTLFENSLWKFATNRLQMNHYVWTFLDNYDWVVFQLNDKITWKKIEVATTQYLDGEWANRVLSGDTRAEAYSIKIDADNNPQSEICLGNAHLDIELNFTKFIERLKISVGAGGVSEAV